MDDLRPSPPLLGVLLGEAEEADAEGARLGVLGTGLAPHQGAHRHDPERG